MAVATDLEAYWRFDLSDGRDSSGQNLPLTLVGSPTFPAGKIGLALDLDGTGLNYAQRSISDAVFDFGSGDFTIQAWIAASTGSANQNVVTKEDPFGGWRLFTTPTASDIVFGFEQVGVGTVSTPAVAQAPGTFHHVVVVKSAGSVEIFVNGASLAGPTALGAIVASPSALIVGYGLVFMEGQVDEVAVWSRALESTEVSQLYNSGSGLELNQAPTITSVTPSEGVTRGETFVSIEGTGFNVQATGGSVRVYFDGVEAEDETGVVDSTRIIALTPRSTRDDPAAVDVKVENVLPNPPGPDLVDEYVLTEGFTYKRPNLETKRDKSTDTAILIVARTLVRDLRRYVLANTHWDMHPEYADDVSALAPQEVQSTAPSLTLIGPNVQEDRENNTGRGQFNLQVTPAPGTFEVLSEPVTVMLTFEFVGLGNTKGEAVQLWEALTTYVKRTENFDVPLDGVDEANGTVSVDLDPVWEQRGDFSRGGPSDRQGIYQFRGSFVVGAVPTGIFKVSEGADVDPEVTVTVEPYSS